eukprot:g15423.t1
MVVVNEEKEEGWKLRPPELEESTDERREVTGGMSVEDGRGLWKENASPSRKANSYSLPILCDSEIIKWAVRERALAATFTRPVAEKEATASGKFEDARAGNKHKTTTTKTDKR